MSVINFRNAHFLISAPSIKECPPEQGIEIAFAGRSNAGKSSAINTLTDNGKLAKTSKTPGRTQLINHFGLDQAGLYRLVDLPGYGYAKVPLATKKKWQQNLNEYLKKRESLKGMVLLMDIRHPMQEFDALMINQAVEVEMPIHILLTKSDKLKRGPINQTLNKLKSQMQEAQIDDLISVQTFSSLKKQGLDELTQKLHQWYSQHTTQYEPSDEVQQDSNNPLTDK